MKFVFSAHVRTTAIAVFILAGLLLSLQGRASANTVRPAISCKRTGTVVTSPDVGANTNVLEGAAGISLTDAWTVGSYIDTSSGVAESHTLTEHWDGNKWSVVSSPIVGTFNDTLYGVAAVSSTDVWAVGDSDFGSHIQPLILHWNGSGWSVVPSPTTSLIINILARVAVVSASDIWAIGYAFGPGNDQALIEHWDGSVWSLVSGANVGTTHDLQGVTAVSSNNVWAVGYTTSTIVTVTEKWNGTKWKVVPSPNPGTPNRLYGVKAITPKNIWAVGNQFIPAIQGNQTLIEHWNGTSWSVVASPSIPNFSNNLVDVAAVSASNVWAVGASATVSTSALLTMHWNGISWSTIAGPGVSGSSAFNGAAHVPGTNKVWAVGSFTPGSVSQTLIVYYC